MFIFDEQEKTCEKSVWMGFWLLDQVSGNVEHAHVASYKILRKRQPAGAFGAKKGYWEKEKEEGLPAPKALRKASLQKENLKEIKQKNLKSMNKKIVGE
jgi:hypothetical protein